MKVVMYGTDICIDCVNDKKILVNREDIEVEFRDITKDIGTLKEFLRIRDISPMFEDVRKSGSVGIPLYILEDGTMTFEISDFLDVESGFGSCSIDKKGC
jgi:glutaredoxin-related protein